AYCARAEERIEVRRCTIVRSRDQRTTTPRAPVTRVELDTRQVSLKSCTLIVRTARQWATELDGRRMQVGVAVWPNRVIRIAVEACCAIWLEATRYCDQRRSRRREAIRIVPIRRLPVVFGVASRARLTRYDAGWAVAGFEVTSLI